MSETRGTTNDQLLNYDNNYISGGGRNFPTKGLCSPTGGGGVWVRGLAELRGGAIFFSWLGTIGQIFVSFP